MSNPLSAGYMATIEALQEEIARLKRDRGNLIHEFKEAIQAKDTLNAARTEMVEDAASLEFWMAFDTLQQIIAEIEGRAA